MNVTPAAAQRKICTCMRNIASSYGNHLSITMVGFGSSLQELSVLKEMTEAFQGTRAKAEFVMRLGTQLPAS
jgi:hypothetical protein